MDVLTEVPRYLSQTTAVRVDYENVRNIAVYRNERNLLAVRRPDGRVVFVRTRCDLPHFAAVPVACCIDNVHFHAAVAVRDEHNLPAVRRPASLIVNNVRKQWDLFEWKRLWPRLSDRA